MTTSGRLPRRVGTDSGAQGVLGVRWTKIDNDHAYKQGWGIFHSDVRGFEIERDDDKMRFETDDEAFEYVTGRADAGDERAKRALAIHRKQRGVNAREAARLSRGGQ